MGQRTVTKIEVNEEALGRSMEMNLAHVVVKYFFVSVKLAQFDLLVITVVDFLRVRAIGDPGFELDVLVPVFLQRVMRADFEK